MRPLTVFALVVLLTGAAPAAPVPKAVKKKVNDTELLVGTWKPVGGRTEWFEFTADGGMKAWNTGGSAKSGAPYSWSVTPNTDPKRMTWGDTSPQRRPQWECIFELDGDKLRLAYVSAGNSLPATVGSGNGVFFSDLIGDTTAK